MPFFKDTKQKKSKSVNNNVLLRSVQSLDRNSSLKKTGFQVAEIDKKKSISRSCTYADEETILLNAVAREDTASVRRVLANGRVNINVIRHPGLSPLHRACITGNLNIVKLLLRYGADLNQVSKTGTTALKIAALHGHFDVSEYLIAMGAKDGDIVHGVQEE